MAVETSVDAALGRLALLLRIIGAVWMSLLVLVYGLSDDLQRPDVAVGVTSLGVAWAVLAWSSGRMRRPRQPDWGLLTIDLAVTVAVLLISASVETDVGYVGGYPFAALVVGLAAAGRPGVVASVVTLSVATLVALGVGGVGLGAFVVGQMLLYVLGAVALLFGIDVIRRNERRARQAEAALLVAEERATTAAHLHDSVLQTLALVQRRADDSGAVRSLAKRQERELREWLFPTVPTRARSGPASPQEESRRDRVPYGTTTGTTLLSALQTLAEDIEERHGVAVGVIAVGGSERIEVPTDDRSPTAALVQATREAMVNAAEHSGVAQVDVFAETDETTITVFIRDRGIGFDVDAIPEDRHGVRGSIVERMSRAGGRATVRSGHTLGTEVQLHLPLTPGSAT